jgi:hypothetical protein
MADTQQDSFGQMRSLMNRLVLAGLGVTFLVIALVALLGVA